VAQCLHARPSRNLSQFIVNRLCSGTPELWIVPYIDGTITRYPRYSISHCRTLQRIDVFLPQYPPTWVQSPAHLAQTRGYLIPEDQVLLEHRRVELTKPQVHALTDRLSWPVGRELQLRDYLYRMPTYHAAKRLTRELVSAGYCGSIFLIVCLRCEQSSEVDSGWRKSYGRTGGEYLVHLSLCFDLRKHDRLSGAKAKTWFRDANDGEYIHSA